MGGAPGTGPLPGAAGGTSTGGGYYPLLNSGGALFVCCGMGSALWLTNSIFPANDYPSCDATGLGDGGHNLAYPDTSCPVSTTGATLNGQVVPNGNPTSYRFEYGTTQDYGSSTAAQEAGNGLSGVPAAAGVGGLTPGTTYHYRVVATNPGGSVAGEDRRFTTQADAAPVILSASLRPKRFAVKRRSGTTFRYRLSEAATVTFTIKRRHMRAKRFRVASAAGANRHRFSGRIRRRPLRPGRYRATLVARDAAGNASQPKRLRFTVVRG